MSYLDQFLKENDSSQQSQVHALRQFEAISAQALYQGGSIESEEGDIEDNRDGMASSKSNLSDISMESV